jgi:Flp pilus assembly protein TadG
MNCIQSFPLDRRGNFAIFGAILCVPIVMAAGVAVDLSTISQHKSELQHAIDSAVLAVAREGKGVTDQQAEDIANTFITNNLDPTYTKMVVVRDGTAVSLRAETRAPMAFGALFGYDQYPVVAAATADIAFATYEVALVLDTTGSMAGGKLLAMKDAVTGMIDSMSSQVTDKEKLKFSLVPFSSFVNVGPEHGPKFDRDGAQIAGTGASWLDLKGMSPVEQVELGVGASRFQIYRNLGQEWKGCVETRMPGRDDYDVSDVAADPNRPESLYVPAFAIDEPEKPGYVNSYISAAIDPFDDSIAATRRKFAKYGVETDERGNPRNGGLLADVAGLLVGLLTGGEDDDDDDEGGGSGRSHGAIPIDTGPSGYQGFAKGPNFGCATKPIVALTNDYADLKSAVNALEARGTTNITEGVAWGLRVLTPGEPFAEAKKKSETGVEKIMVVLTDGANVFGVNNTDLNSHYTSYGYLYDGRLGIADGSAASTNTVMNEKTLAACEYAKKEGIIVYTIRLEEPDVKTGTMLAECATSSAHYFDAPSRSQLDEVFETIKDRIVRVRISS